MFTHFIQKLSLIFASCKARLRSCFHFIISNEYACEIKEFDLQAKEVVVCFYGVRIIIIRSSIAEIIGDSNIVNNLPPFQSCWLGYYYGKLCAQSSSDSNYFYSNSGSFLLKFTKGRFKIFSLDRNNILTYLDVRTNKSYKQNPLTIAQDKSIISQFDSSPACYIGILAGLMVAKKGEHLIEANKKPILTLVGR